MKSDSNKSIIFFLLIAVIYSGLFLLRFGLIYQSIYLGIGLLVGAVLVWWDDHQAWRYYQEEVAAPGAPTHQRYVITRSLLFIGVLMPLTLFVITSTGSAIGLGLVMGILLSLTSEVAMLRQQPAVIRSRYLHQLHKPLSVTEVNQLVYVFLIICAALVVMSLL